MSDALSGTCPSCGARADLVVFAADATAREALRAALSVQPALADRVLAYMGLHRPGKTHAVSWPKLARLLDELAGAMREGAIRRDGQRIAAPPGLWAQAIDHVLAERDGGRLRLPLKGHGYLYAVIANQANAYGARAEAERETARRERRPGEESAMPANAAAQAEARRIRSDLTGLERLAADMPEGEQRAALEAQIAKARARLAEARP